MVSAFLRMHPLLPLSKEALAEYGELVLHGPTVSVDLSYSLEDIWSNTRRNHRQNIQQLTQAGFQPYMNRWELYDDFVSIYHQTMERREACDFYFFQRDYFVSLRETLGDYLHLCVVLSPSGDLAAGLLLVAVNGIVQCHLSATHDAYTSDAPSKLTFHHARTWAKESGNHVFHLGGGVGGYADSLFRFKAGFSKDRHNYYTYRMILDEQRYATLLSSPQVIDDYSNNNSDYFPMYRTP
jgi:lipid II:glycine glycyltransferase (peptidoglycan interpeptide bridge formation enzyme)